MIVKRNLKRRAAAAAATAAAVCGLALGVSGTASATQPTGWLTLRNSTPWQIDIWDSAGNPIYSLLPGRTGTEVFYNIRSLYYVEIYAHNFDPSWLMGSISEQNIGGIRYDVRWGLPNGPYLQVY